MTNKKKALLRERNRIQAIRMLELKIVDQLAELRRRRELLCTEDEFYARRQAKLDQIDELLQAEVADLEMVDGWIQESLELARARDELRAQRR